MVEPRTITFTEEDNTLLSKYSKFYEELDSGRRKPTTKEQEHFVMACRYQAAAETLHEKVWIKKKRQMTYEIQKRHKEKEKECGIPETEEGTPRPGWFTDEDWEKMRAADYADMVNRGRRF